MKNHRELFQALLDGKKIRRCRWQGDEYIKMMGDNIIDENGETFEGDIELDRIYEYSIYLQELSKEDLMQLIRDLVNAANHDDQASAMKKLREVVK